MPVSSEENFQEKLLIFNDWLKNKERYRGEDISVSPHKSSEASGFSNETFSCTVLGKNIREDIVLRIKPTGFQVFPDYDLGLQVEIMNELKKFNLPVPEILFQNLMKTLLDQNFM